VKDHKDWFIERLSGGLLDLDNARQIAGLICQLDRTEEHERERRYEAGLNAAMLADLCEVRFGGNANGAPSLWAYAHAGWACGPVSLVAGESYVKRMLTSWFREKGLNADLEKNMVEWEAFLKKEVSDG